MTEDNNSNLRLQVHKLLGQADDAVEAHDYETAAELYTKAIEINPHDRQVFINRGNVYEHIGKWNLAIENYTRAIKLNPKPADAYSGRGNAYAKKGEYDLAIADFSKVIELLGSDYPGESSVLAYNGRGRAYKKKGEDDFAVQSFDQAIEILDKKISREPKNSHWHRMRGDVYVEKGEYDLAIADYTRAVVLNPWHVWAYHNRGVAYDKKGDEANASRNYSKAYELDSDFLWEYPDRILSMLNREGSNDDLEELLEQAKEANAQGNFDIAIELCDKAIALDPEDSDAYYNRGIAYVERGKLDSGVSLDLSGRVLRLNPEVIRGDYELAIEDFGKAMDLGFYASKPCHSRGLAYMLKGDFDRAVADFTEAIEYNPDNADAYRDRAIAYILKGETALAIKDYSEAMELTTTPNTPRPPSWSFYLRDVRERREQDK
ncbi:MAG: tetratricopeptide repeat protein [Alphaproteobacteria bacterium]|nr:tetratricopeptide repeat protein [Alphaproteobacteria bacterium]